MVILYVDDDPSLLELLQEYLEARGHTLLRSQSQLGAVPLLRQHRVDVALIDYHLAVGDARLLTRNILEGHPETRVVMVTGDHSIETATEIYRLGVGSVLLKPFRLKDLAETLFGEETVPPYPPPEVFEALRPESRLRLTVYSEPEGAVTDAIRSVLLRHPDDAYAQWLLAFCYYRQNRFDDAAHLLRAIAENGEPPARKLLVFYYLGACQYRRGRMGQALETWRRLAAVDPSGPLCSRVRQHIRAVEAFMSAERSEPPRIPDLARDHDLASAPPEAAPG